LLQEGFERNLHFSYDADEVNWLCDWPLRGPELLDEAILVVQKELIAVLDVPLTKIMIQSSPFTFNTFAWQ